MIQLVYFLSYISLFLSIPGLTYTVVKFKKIPFLRGSFLFLFAEQFLISWGSYLLSRNQISNHLLLNIDSFLILLIASSFYYKYFKAGIVLAIVLYFLFIVWYSYNFDIKEYSSLLYFVSSAIVILLSLIQLFLLIFDISSNVKITNRPMFYLNCGFLIYFSLTLITTVFNSYFLNQGLSGYSIVVIIQFIGALMLNVFSIIGLWKVKVK